MKKFIVVILMLLVSNIALANELLGKWSSSKNGKYIVVLFEDDSMTQASSKDMKKNVMSIKVKYVKLNNAYGIELLDENNKKVAAMMVSFEGDDTIKFGAPGSVFIELKREK